MWCVAQKWMDSFPRWKQQTIAKDILTRNAHKALIFRPLSPRDGRFCHSTIWVIQLLIVRTFITHCNNTHTQIVGNRYFNLLFNFIWFICLIFVFYLVYMNATDMSTMLAVWQCITSVFPIRLILSCFVRLIILLFTVNCSFTSK